MHIRVLFLSIQKLETVIDLVFVDYNCIIILYNTKSKNIVHELLVIVM